MSAARSVLRAFGLLASAAIGFAAAAAGSAHYRRLQAAKLWQDLRVEHRGQAGEATQTRIRMLNQKLFLESLEVLRSEKGEPVSGTAVLRGGQELAIRFDARRPHDIYAKDGSHARLDYKGRYIWVTLTGNQDQSLGQQAVKVPIELRKALRVAQLPEPGATQKFAAWSDDLQRGRGPIPGLDTVGRLLGSIIPSAQAQQAKRDNATLTIERDVLVNLSVRGAKSDATSTISAACKPFNCSPGQPKLTTPGNAQVRIAVTTQVARNKLKGANGTEGLEAHTKQAARERSQANRAMAGAASLVAGLAVTAQACRKLGQNVGVCVASLDKAKSEAATYGLSHFRLQTKGRVLQERAMVLRNEHLARRIIDKNVRLEVCVSRRGFARSCARQIIRPFAERAQAPVDQTIVLKRGLAGTVSGTFELVQRDGADCKFSPSPRTSGQLSLRFDQKTGMMTAKLNASERGKRTALDCSLGTGDMHWTQAYTAKLSQRFSDAQLRTAGSRLPLRLKGTMRGSGNFRWQNCKSKSGTNAACPGGKTAPYTYRMELVGYLDTSTQRGSGQLRVSGSPLKTSGRWGVPKK